MDNHTKVFLLCASAGGLEALEKIIRKIPIDFQAALVVASHLSPSEKSVLTEILSRMSRLPTIPLEEEVELKPGTIYVVQPNRDYILQNDRLIPVDFQNESKGRPSLNRLISSFAFGNPRSTIAVILSGTGTDGTEGITNLVKRGGYVIAQSIESSKHSGMPRSAIESEVVDIVADVDDIYDCMEHALEVLKIKSPNRSDLRKAEQDSYSNILADLKHQTLIDFNKYKPNTVYRRIAKRMIATLSKSIESYYEYVQQNPSEIKLLKEDLLIGVTGFFRDKSEYACIQREVEKKINAEKVARFRCWSIGCSTGEEPYSIAILIDHAMKKNNGSFDIKVYATDISNAALKVAREGKYLKKNLVHFGDISIDDYFDEIEPGVVKVKPFVRRMVTFAYHNIFTDPAFISLDLVVIRNVLIYFKNPFGFEVQKKITRGLKKGGLYFLGNADNLGRSANDFEIIENAGRIYKKTSETKDRDFEETHHNQYEPYPAFSIDRSLTKNKVAPSESAPEVPLKMMFPDSLLLDQEHRVLGVFGQASKLLAVPEGNFTNDIEFLVVEKLRVQLLSIIEDQKHAKNEEYVFFYHDSNIDHYVRVEQISIHEKIHIVIRLCSVKVTPKQNGETQKPVDYLETEKDTLIKKLLAETRQLKEELNSKEASFQKVIEDLQATNEEFETSNEELQSTNEELITVNEELDIKTNEIEGFKTFLFSIINNLNRPVFVVDDRLEFLLVNHSAKTFFGIEDSFSKNLAAIKSGLAHKILHMVSDYFRGDEVHPSNSSFQVASKVYQVTCSSLNSSTSGEKAVLVMVTDKTPEQEIIEKLSRLVLPLYSFFYESETPSIVALNNGEEIVANRKANNYGILNGSKFIDNFPISLLWFNFAEDISTNHPILPITFSSDKYEKILKDRAEVRGTVLETNVKASIYFLGENRDKLAGPNATSIETLRRVFLFSTDAFLIFKKEKNESFKVEIANESAINLYNRFLPKDQRTEGIKSTDLKDFLSVINRGDLRKAEKEQKEIIRLSSYHDYYEIIEGQSPTHLSFYFNRIESSESQYIWVFAKDATDLVNEQSLINNLKEKNFNNNKLALLGEMAAAIAHEVKTPLNVVQANADLMAIFVEEDLTENQEMYHKLLEIASAISATTDQIASVIDGLKDFSKMGLGTKETEKKVSLVDSIEKASRICEYSMQHWGVEFKQKRFSSDAFVTISSVQLDQIFVNLINNSIEAIKHGKDRRIWVEETGRNDSSIQLSFNDSGPGIPKRVVESIFQPFFTTKTEGTGLGLSLIANLLKSAGGDIKYKDKGHTSFELTIPLADS